MFKIISAQGIFTVILGTSLLISTPAFAAPQNLPSQADHPNIPATTSGQNGKMQACQARENAIKQRSSQLVRLVTNMESKFDSIAKRVENYYTLKVVPSGKTVSNYNSLVADIQTKKAAVQVAVTTSSNDQSNFSCTSSDPKAQMQIFRVDMQNVKRALADYRTSIKNLIVAVRGVVGETESSSSASPMK